MKILLITVTLINIIYYILVMIGNNIQNHQYHLAKNFNMITRIAGFLLVIITGFIPIINFIIATMVLYQEVKKVSNNK